MYLMGSWQRARERRREEADTAAAEGRVVSEIDRGRAVCLAQIQRERAMGVSMVGRARRGHSKGGAGGGDRGEVGRGTRKDEGKPAFRV